MTQIINTRLNILLVEDDDDDVLFFKKAIEELEVVNELIIAGDCGALFSELDGQRIFDVIFLDINLPITNGKECLKRIKANEKYKDVPVIIFSGSNAPHDVNDVYEYGAHYHVVKPYAHINYVAALKIVLGINWKEKQPIPLKENFVVNLTFN